MDRTVAPFVVSPFVIATIQATGAGGLVVKASTGATVATFAAGIITIADAVDIATNTTTGTKIGTAVGQKIGFWNVTPVVQPAAAGQAAAAAITQNTLTDNSGGLVSTTIAAISDTPTKDAVASIVAQLAKVKADIAARDTLLTAIRTALVNTGIIKGAA